MKRVLLLIVFAFGALFFWQFGQPSRGPEQPSKEPISWVTSFSEGLEQAKEKGEPVMVDFYADWCGPCKMLDQQTYADQRVVTAATNWISVKVDVDQNQELSAKYQVHSIPTIVFISPEGEAISRITGSVPAETMVREMQKARGQLSDG